MNKIDEQPNRGSHTVGGGVDASTQGVPSLPGSQPITVEAVAFRAVDQRSEPDDLLQTVSSKTTSRRAWLRRGVAAASPVVASLVSAPVYAAGACVLPSGFGSIATLKSRHPDAMVCTTQGPNFWVNNLGAWPADTTIVNVNGNARTAVKLKDAFRVGPKVEPGLIDPTLNEVLLRGSLLAKYSVAAYLNAKKGTLNFPLTADQAIAVYKSYRPGVAVNPPLVVTWTEAETVTWLKILMS